MPWMSGMVLWLESLIGFFSCNYYSDVSGIGNRGIYEDEYSDCQNRDSGILYSHEHGNGIENKIGLGVFVLCSGNSNSNMREYRLVRSLK